MFVGGTQAATNVVEEVKQIWCNNPDANIGIATGSTSGIIALDVDPRNGGDASLRQLSIELGRLPSTVRVRTGGGGSHRLYAYPKVAIKTKHCPGGIDFQSDGALIVAPPSLHASGRHYRFRTGRDPRSIALAPLPKAWLAHLQGASVSVADSLDGATEGRIPEGERNTRLTKQAGALHRVGASEAALMAALKAENVARCVPPLDEVEIAKIVGSVMRYPAGAADGDQAEAVMQLVLDQHFTGGAHLLLAFDGRFYWYDGTVWAPLNDKVLSGRVLATIQGLPARPKGQTASLMGQVVRLIEAKVAADGDVLRFNAPPLPVINCRNGELWIKPNGRFELKPHRADSYLRHRLDVDYDPQAECADYDEAVEGIFAKATDPATMVGFWHELMGYMLQPRRPIPLVALGWGAGNNGKTKLVETFMQLVGPELIVAMPISELEKSRFTSGNLLGKLAIIDDDVKAGTRLPDGQLKRLSEEKTITGENKFGPSFTFTVRTAILMLFNPPPTLADLSHGMQRRLVVVPFTRVFTKEDDDPKLFPRIWAEEMPGVLNRFLDGLRRVMRRGWQFEPPADSVEAKSTLLKAVNPVPAFIDERCEREGSIYVQPLFEAYRDWAQGAGITFHQQRLAFQRNLESLGFKANHGRQGPKIHGLRLRS